jgi:hypothetical protein
MAERAESVIPKRNLPDYTDVLRRLNKRFAEGGVVEGGSDRVPLEPERPASWRPGPASGES